VLPPPAGSCAGFAWGGVRCADERDPARPRGAIESVAPEGFQFPQGQDHAGIFSAVVDDHYFRTIGTAIVRGRAFSAADRDGSLPVIVVNEQFAKTYWPGQDPIGKRVRLNASGGRWLEVIGVARTGKYL